ncbi:MAG TPA: nuclear transport factor 2 family protein [Oligoflexus sp.]|uniref:nuclear transport factor 2 family protein n=1 Tax=Oligoflexus sp. TaxID=1971216 RepID=UPI002D43CF54|nr:nuclear transport factor 2 family protein [Oligoflexus sp.]HYX34445.1 nuclear transport factor 2 family protein [Oligoflexus sp.]
MTETTPSANPQPELKPAGQESSRNAPERSSFEEAGHLCKLFISTLHQIEQTPNVDLMASLFDDNAELWRQSFREPYHGIPGVRRFWKEYLDQFEHVHSNFHRVVQRDKIIILEWLSEGALLGGRPIHYAGVSILESGADDKIVSFRTYFDSAHFLTPQALAH